MLVDQFEHLTFRFSPQPKHLLLVVLEIRLWGLSCRSCLIAARKREAKIGNKSVHMHISVMCGVADSCSFVFFKCVLCNATDLWWNDATFLNKSILKLPWIKFSGAILDDRMFTFIIFPFFFLVPPSKDDKSVSLYSLFATKGLTLSPVYLYFKLGFFWNEHRVFLATHFSLLLSLVDCVRCIHIPVFIYLRESWIFEV